jgi:hypothetical protein
MHKTARCYLIGVMTHKSAIAPKCVTATHNVLSDLPGNTSIYMENGHTCPKRCRLVPL